mgnify:CR=1 FL=1
MIHEIKGFAKKKTLDIIDTMKSRMIKFDGRLTAGKFAAKVKTSNATLNADAGKYQYLAFAENPFKYSTAR